MTSSARASVAMATYNGERFLAEQIDSILPQLLADDELVISYDRSADGTLSIITDYARRDTRVRVVENGRPGIVSNFNNALANCTGDVIFISDQDDIWLPGKRSAVMEAIEANHPDLLIHNGYHVDERGRQISGTFFEIYGIREGLVRNFAKPRYSGCCMAFPWTTLELIHPMPASVVNYDHWIGMACEVYGSIELLDKVLLAHRMHSANATVTRRPLAVVARQRANLARELLRRRKAADGWREAKACR